MINTLVVVGITLLFIDIAGQSLWGLRLPLVHAYTRLVAVSLCTGLVVLGQAVRFVWSLLSSR